MEAEHVAAEDFAQAVGAHRSVMYRLALTLRRASDPEDIVQDALSRAWAKQDLFDPERGTLRSWLLAIVADRAHGHARAEAREHAARATALETLIDPEALVASPPAAHDLDLHRQIAALPPRQRAAVVLHYLVDLPVNEVAQVMACSPGTVKSTLHDARIRLARELGDSYGDD